MSSQGYSTFFVFGSGCAAGLTTRTYMRRVGGRRAGDGQRERHERPLLLRLQEERRQRHLDIARRGLASHDAVDQLDQLFDLRLLLLAALLVSSFLALACCANAAVEPASATATAATSAMTRRLTIIESPCRAAITAVVLNQLDHRSPVREECQTQATASHCGRGFAPLRQPAA